MKGRFCPHVNKYREKQSPTAPEKESPKASRDDDGDLIMVDDDDDDDGRKEVGEEVRGLPEGVPLPIWNYPEEWSFAHHPGIRHDLGLKRYVGR